MQRKNKTSKKRLIALAVGDVQRSQVNYRIGGNTSKLLALIALHGSLNESIEFQKMVEAKGLELFGTVDTEEVEDRVLE